jgi:hypothetical protein
MRHRAVRLGSEGVRALRGLGEREGLTVSQALRKAAILGVGGSAQDAAQANAYMLNRATVLSTSLGDLPGRRGAALEATGDAENVVSCRMPQPWNARLSARGAFAAAVRAGMATWARLR